MWCDRRPAGRSAFLEKAQECSGGWSSRFNPRQHQTDNISGTLGGGENPVLALCRWAWRANARARAVSGSMSVNVNTRQRVVTGRYRRGSSPGVMTRPSVLSWWSL